MRPKKVRLRAAENLPVEAILSDAIDELEFRLALQDGMPHWIAGSASRCGSARANSTMDFSVFLTSEALSDLEAIVGLS